MSSELPENRQGAWLSLLFISALVGTGLFVGSAIIGLLAATTGLDLTGGGEGAGSVASRMGIRSALVLQQFFTFIIPCFIFFRYFLHGEAKSTFFSWGVKNKAPVVFLSICLLFGALPLVLYSYEWNTRILEWLSWNTDGSSMSGLLRKVLTMEIPPELTVNLLLVAVLPAIGEEWLFRGYFMRMLKDGTNSVHLGIWLSAMAFSAFHFQIEGFLPRMVLGLLLGYAFQWSRTLLIPMIMHFFNNAFQVIAIYAGKSEYSELELADLPPTPLFLVAGSGLCIFLSARLIIRYARKSV